jgi:hypothetical protein
MEDVTLVHDWKPFRDMMHLHSNLDVEHMDDDIVKPSWIGVCFPLGHHFDEMG